MLSRESLNSFTPVGAHRAIIDLTLSNARRLYSTMENPLGVKGLTTSTTMSTVTLSLPLVSANRALINLTLSNARRFYSSMENPLLVKAKKSFEMRGIFDSLSSRINP